jgi:neutral ceramidase
MLKVGNILMAAVPGEFSTMSGRRLKNFIRKEVAAVSGDSAPNTKVLIAGLSNAYSSYVTTFEEYQVQRYEGASTIFGPHTLEAYINQFIKLTNHLMTNTQSSLPPGPEPPMLLKKQLSLRPGVLFDMPVFKHKFGDVILQPDDVYQPGSTVSVVFVAGHPQNNLMLEGTYLTVEQRKVDTEGKEDWKVVATDSSLDTKFIWKRTNPLLGQSVATVQWIIPHDVKPGLYRISHFGSSKSLLQHVNSYEGRSKTFQVVPQKFFRLNNQSSQEKKKHFM